MALASYIGLGEYNPTSNAGDAYTNTSDIPNVMSQFFFPHAGTLLSWRVTHADLSPGFAPLPSIYYYLYKNQSGSLPADRYLSGIKLIARGITGTSTSGDVSLNIAVSAGEFIVVTYATTATSTNIESKVVFKFRPSL